MKYAVAAVLAAAVSGAHAYGKNVTIVTETVDSYVTYCPEPTEIVHGEKTYTVTEPGTVTITDCPCTITKPVVEETHEVCYDCPEEKPEEPKPEEPKPEEPEAPVETPEVQPPAPTGGVTPTGEPEPVPTAGAGKAASVAGLAGVVGLAAFIL